MEPPFNMLITGMTGSGKTMFLLDMLEKEYQGEFDFIVIICPTLSDNKTYQEWRYIGDADVIKIEPTHDNVETFIGAMADLFRNSRTLLIIDDCAASSSVKKRTSELVNLGFGGRHRGLSTIVLTQQLTSITKPFRENISRFVCFYAPAKKDMKQITDDFLNGLTKQQIQEIVSYLRSNKYSALDISLRHPYTIKIVSPDREDKMF